MIIIHDSGNGKYLGEAFSHPPFSVCLYRVSLIGSCAVQHKASCLPTENSAPLMWRVYLIIPLWCNRYFLWGFLSVRRSRLSINLAATSQADVFVSLYTGASFSTQNRSCWLLKFGQKDNKNTWCVSKQCDCACAWKVLVCVCHCVFFGPSMF